MDKHFSQSIDLVKYLAVCEQLGQEPDPNKMPPEMEDYPSEVQQAFLVHSCLPDRWDGMSGMFMGKDWSALGTLLDVFEVDDPRTTVYFLKAIDDRNSNSINEKVTQRNKAAKAKARIK